MIRLAPRRIRSSSAHLYVTPDGGCGLSSVSPTFPKQTPGAGVRSASRAAYSRPLVGVISAARSASGVLRSVFRDASQGNSGTR